MDYDKSLNEYREAYLRLTVEPVIRWVFEKFSAVNSCTLYVAQYWNDEADDAVHPLLVFSELSTPLGFSDEDAEEDSWGNSQNILLNFPTMGFNKRHHDLPWDGWKYKNLDTGEYDGAFKWSENYLAIPLFSAWAKEGQSQESSYAEAYAPYCTYRKDESGAVSRETYPCLREWTDGVVPEWGEEELNINHELNRHVEKAGNLETILNETFPVGPISEETRRLLDVCENQIPYNDTNHQTGVTAVRTFTCGRMRLNVEQSGKCERRHAGCSFLQERK